MAKQYGLIVEYNIEKKMILKYNNCLKNSSVTGHIGSGIVW